MRILLPLAIKQEIWVRHTDGGEYHARCFICKKTINCFNFEVIKVKKRGKNKFNFQDWELSCVACSKVSAG